MTVYWVFTEEQLKLAMRDFARSQGADGVVPCPDFELIYKFLRSPEALAHKLRVEDKSRG